MKLWVRVPLPEPICYNSLCYCCFQRTCARIKVLVGKYIYEYDVCSTCAKKYDRKKKENGLQRRFTKRKHYQHLKKQRKLKLKIKKIRRKKKREKLKEKVICPIQELHKELIGFKNDLKFHTQGFSKKTKYYSWQTKAKRLEQKVNKEQLSKNGLGVTISDLIILGIEYQKEKGKETSFTRFVNKRLLTLYQKHQ